jgi:hypothetical protein
MRATLALGLCLIAFGSPRPVSAQGAAPAVGEAIYAYTDDRGRLIYAHRLSDVPEALRPFARRMDQQNVPKASESPLQALLRLFGDEPAPTSAAAAASGPASMYRYRTREGRVVFTNLAASVPTDQLHTAALDLRHVSINSQLGAELDQELKTQYDLLQAAPFCRGVRAALSEPFWQRIWTEHQPLVVCALAILAFLAITPWVVRRVGGAPWARALSLAIPVLGFVGVSTMLLMKTGRTLSDLHGRAEPCQADAWTRASQSQQPLVQHQQLVQALQAETATLEQIHAESQL